MLHRWKITGTLTTTSPLHIGCGLITNFDHPTLCNDEGEPNDIQAVVRDFRGLPCIPGSALKGVLRSWAETLDATIQPQVERIFGSRNNASDGSESGWAEFCTARLIEPDAGLIERLNQFVPYWNARSFTGILSHVSISRQFGIAEHNKLYFEEFVPEGISFAVEIDATRLNETEIKCLLGILATGTGHPSHPARFGANSADGWGRMRWTPGRVLRSNGLTKTGVGFAHCTESCSLSPAVVRPEASNHVAYTLGLTCNGSFLVNDASRAKPEGASESERHAKANFTVLRRASGEVWLPASSLRGALRSRAEFLLKSLNSQATGDPNGSLGSGPIERIFGRTGNRARLFIEEPSSSEQPQLMRQDFVAIDRFQGGAAEGAKFDALCAYQPSFEVNMRLDLADLQPEDLALFAIAMHSLCTGDITLGWGGAKGYGHVIGTVSKYLPKIDPAWEVPDAVLEPNVSETKIEWLNRCLVKLVGTPEPVPVAATEAAPQPAQWQIGSLIWEGAGKNRRRSISAATQKLPLQLKANLIPQSLASRNDDSIAIEFRREKGQVAEVRAAGEANKNAELPTPVAQPNTFANPYYFLRLNARNEPAKIPPALRDSSGSSGSGHRRYAEGKYSGKLSLKISVKTPLLNLAPLTEAEAAAEHKIYRLNEMNGLPFIASSSIRGMLRAAYEAITNSRLGVLPAKPEAALSKQGNARLLGYRMLADDGLSLVPVMIENGQANLLLGTTPNLPTPHGEKWRVPGDLYAAWVPSYQKNIAGHDRRAVTINGKHPVHGQEAWCWLERMQHQYFTFWRVREAAETEAGLSKAPPAPSPTTGRYSSCNENMIKRQGYFVVSNQNSSNKHDERFFFGNPQHAGLPPTVLSHYLKLLEDCHEMHSDEVAERSRNGQSPTLYTPSIDGPATARRAEIAAMSRHTYDSVPEANDRMLCYAHVNKRGNDFVIKSLHPVMISRKLFEKKPIDLVAKTLQPATTIEELSPADRVFGWVNQNKVLAKGESVAAYRSHVRVGPVKCATDAAAAVERLAAPVTLAILGQPKPQQVRFYLGDRTGKALTKGISKESAGYSEPNRIRGSKVYPHHKLSERYESAAQWMRDNPSAFSENRTNQNRSVTGWVKPGTVFETELRFENLSEVEIGALLWLVTLREDHYFRLGLGKPLGFGSVRVELDQSQSILARGDAWVSALSSVGTLTNEVAKHSELISKFTETMDQFSPDLLHAFQQSARGLGTTPIHYPRLPGKPADEHFHWFVENEKKGKYSLPDLGSPTVSLPDNPA